MKISKLSYTNSRHSSPWWMALVFAGGVFALGMGVAGVAFARTRTKGAKALDAIHIYPQARMAQSILSLGRRSGTYARHNWFHRPWHYGKAYGPQLT
jgi:hypothetical protein